MLHYFILASLVATGLSLATTAFRAGLRQFATGIAVTSVGGYGAFAIEMPLLGWPLVGLSVVLIIASRHVMKKHAAGPFAASGKR